MTTQAPHAIRTVVALVAAGAGLPISEQNIRVKTHDIGGGFGGKVPVYPGYVLAVAASFLIGKPVKWIEDRSENLQADSFARDYHIDIEVGANKAGKIQAMKVKTIADHGYTDAAADPSKYPAGLFNVITGSYDFQNAFVEVDGVYTNKPPGGVAYRCSFRVTEAVHAVERIVDVLAHEIGKDPAQLRMENFIQPEQFPYHTPTGWELRLGRLSARPASSPSTRSATTTCARSRPRSANAASSWASASARSPRSSGRGQVHGLRHPRHQDVRLVRDPGPPDGQGHRQARRPVAGPGPRDDLRPDHRRGARFPGRRHQDRGRRHRHGAVWPRHLRLALHAGRRRGHGRRVSQDPGQGPELAAHLLESPRRTSSGSPASSASRARRTSSRPSRRSPSRRTPTCPTGWRPGSRRSTTTTRRT